MKKTLRFLKIAALFLLALIAVYALFNFQLVQYGFAQLKGQVNILYNASPIEEKMQDKNFPDSLKIKLKLIQEIKTFARDSLGLEISKNYTHIYDQKGKPVLWVITACRAFSMKEYTWEFPFLGAVSYKGFFEKERGQPELQKLQELGYDTEYRPVSAWSTLGWFEDPILSNMLRRSEGQLAELIIHELTHTTLYLPGSVDYNENFATYVGEQGAIQFLKNKYGSNHPVYTNYLHYQSDEKLYGEYMLKSTQMLDQFYQQMDTTLTRQEKLHLKYRKIASLLLESNQLTLHEPKKYQFDFKKETLPNNTFFMAFSRYRKQQNEFNVHRIYSGKDLRQFILDQKKLSNR